ncbi:histidine--tRNA ligase [Subtercola frigoramans]|uniref:Histidine--tRNA ligase n=1 Tax=Subtercola frigoramans TaxID=120298 RepID=A0ABS2L3H8_9MICO|nr:histidine--tRNA ligase [Subtercola frigoramans]MBM7471622.1 histidyl-tRNA synthetase [Subtercola frigoramans]
MAHAITPPRGMRDFLPAEKAARERALGIIRRSYTTHGFDEIETPVMEDIERLHSGLGGDNEKLSFSVLKRAIPTAAIEAAAAADDAQQLADLGLRFDLTVPLARFYASHRAELPAVFRAIQIAPVWRAERPQKGRYRQFVQCDIDIIGEPTLLAEAEIITATLATLDALGLENCTIRINDRRLLTAMLEVFGFAAAEHPQVLITVDKLDKIGQGGVVAELRERGATPAAVDALDAFFHRIQTREFNPFGVRAITKALPSGVDEALIADLASLADSVDPSKLQFDPFLVRGMGYYTGTIFEIAHPDFAFSLGGGGRYDGMIGRFLGTDVAACGFSIGFERIVDLLQAEDAGVTDALLLLHDSEASAAQLVGLKSQLVAAGTRVRLERRIKNTKAQLDRAAAGGYTSFAFVGAGTHSVEDLDVKAI